MPKLKKVRDLVYGFVVLDEQECAVVDHPVFQRLRRIKQLSLTDMVYPGANHTRFEHSIGVMQMATDMFDSIVAKKKQFLEDELSLVDSGIQIYRKIVRLAALLHDVGHTPFSHSGEDLMPLLPATHVKYVEGQQKRYEHEEYSIEIIKNVFKDIIENHPVNDNYRIRVEDVTALLGDTTVRLKAKSLLWKELISGQLDADRADYLLRDSLHLGVSYGIYDKNRLVSCMTIGKTETEAPVLAIEEGGWHIAESLVIARYQMFAQVYFHKVRRIYDYHIYCATKEVLKYLKTDGACYPLPTDIKGYLDFDDWTIYSALKKGLGGKHGEIVLNRNHYKCIAKTQLIPTQDEEIEMQELKQKHVGKNHYLDDKASTSWYKLDKDILICGDSKIQPLSEKSNIVKAMIEKPRQQRFYIEHD
ncbi:MAG: HD domain-containing protein [Syntrophomonas sp.]|nr:HD domain-containing protein [Syntrophomonas sp.]